MIGSLVLGKVKEFIQNQPKHLICQLFGKSRTMRKTQEKCGKSTL